MEIILGKTPAISNGHQPPQAVHPYTGMLLLSYDKIQSFIKTLVIMIRAALRSSKRHILDEQINQIKAQHRNLVLYGLT